MAYDVFVVSALEDRDMANLVVRRLRALKFKCWFDKKQTDTTFDQKDARNALNSQTMLVLWSKDAVSSDWVRAAASVGNSRPGMLLEIGLDDTIPYEPFSINKRHSLEGMTTRTTVDGFYDVVDELGRRDGRRDLREWLQFGKDDQDRKAAWLANHPSDPMSIAEEKKRERELAAESGAEIKAASGTEAVETKDAETTTVVSTSSASSSVTASDAKPGAGDEEVKVIGSGYGEGVGKVPGTPGAPYKPGRKGPAGVTSAASVAAATRASEPSLTTPAQTDADEGIGRWVIAGILLGIASLFLLSGLLRTSPTPKQLSYAGQNTSSSSMVAGEEIIRIADACPAGYISSSALAEPPQQNAKEDEEE